MARCTKGGRLGSQLARLSSFEAGAPLALPPAHWRDLDRALATLSAAHSLKRRLPLVAVVAFSGSGLLSAALRRRQWACI
eukprot:4736422-Alexandrium_andersonii.AAC.1